MSNGLQNVLFVAVALLSFILLPYLRYLMVHWGQRRHSNEIEAAMKSYRADKGTVSIDYRERYDDQTEAIVRNEYGFQAGSHR